MTMSALEETWWEDVACAGEDPLTFSVPPGKHVVPKSYWEKARSLCDACPVKTECLEYMLTLPLEIYDLPVHHSMFAAGLTPQELNHLQRQRDRTTGGLR